MTFIALFLACIELECAFVPLHPDQAASTVAGVLRDTRPLLCEFANLTAKLREPGPVATPMRP